MLEVIESFRFKDVSHVYISCFLGNSYQIPIKSGAEIGPGSFGLECHIYDGSS